MDADELLRSACTPSQLLLDTMNAPDGSWVIDKGKQNGATPGFRIKIAVEVASISSRATIPVPERPECRRRHRRRRLPRGLFQFSCEQVVHVKASVFAYAGPHDDRQHRERVRPFDEKALGGTLAR